MAKQDYSAQPKIPGVVIKDLKVHQMEDGDFTELVRLENEDQVQFNLSTIEGRRIKAFHAHDRQFDIWIPLQRLVIGLYDPKTKIKMKFASEMQMIYIPKGILHGCKNAAYEPRQLLYAVNRFFDPVNPDELRHPFDMLGYNFWDDSIG